ncbi:uncharacterized protein LOC122365917 [Amphibalanus amphitrite]|uniref:uncharacterized protein LOC122365917 n=1 Tax=Amphibalanus amphitrite TaxID=1232801 RepID=UPI001C90C3A8|nr:uncharacterized protein LOC122365917 [Amphibalanus amphitrite]
MAGRNQRSPEGARKDQRIDGTDGTDRHQSTSRANREHKPATVMKTLVLLCCLVAVGSAAPQFFIGRPSSATGGAQGTVTTGSSNNAQITSVQATAQGSVNGSGSSTNTAFASNVSTNGFFGSNSQSNTLAQSNQQTFGVSSGFRPVNNRFRPVNNRFRPSGNRFSFSGNRFGGNRFGRSRFTTFRG